jgi:Leucine-rich repeat (LRR) protein
MRQPRHSLEASIESGDSKVHEKCVRCANKGITHITTFKGYENVEQLFISSNLIQTLDGIQNFKELRVLSISFNDISKISDLKFLTGIPLQTLNMEGNPITRLPYYQHHAVSRVPTLRLFDGRPVDDGLRSRADSTASFDIQRLTELCINEARMSALQSLIADIARPEDEWLSEVQRVFGFTTLESLGMSQSDVDANFDRMRAVALDFRERQKCAAKWVDVYSSIEAIQTRAIEDFSVKIRARAQKIEGPHKVKTRVACPSPFKLGDSKLRSPKQEQTPPTQMKPSPLSSSPRTTYSFPATPGRISPVETHTDDRWMAIRRLHDRQKLHRIIQVWAGLTREPPNLCHWGQVFAITLKRLRVAQKFHFWKGRWLSNRRRYCADHCHLLEQAQEAVSRISELECQLASERKTHRNVRAALEESVRNEGKMQSVIRKMSQETGLLEKSLQASEKKYDDEVLQFMLESKFKCESNHARVAELEQTLARLEDEKTALSTFIQQSQTAHRRELEELQARLGSAFEVTSGFRREISRLKAELESPAGREGFSASESPSPNCAKRRRRNSAQVQFPVF